MHKAVGDQIEIRLLPIRWSASFTAEPPSEPEPVIMPIDQLQVLFQPPGQSPASMRLRPLLPANLNRLPQARQKQIEADCPA